MRFSYALFALAAAANALTTETSAEQRSVSSVKHDDRGVQEWAHVAELEARAESFQLEERKKKKNKHKHKHNNTAGAANNITAPAVDQDQRSNSDSIPSPLVAELEARAESFQLEERKKKKNKNKHKHNNTAGAANNITARAVDQDQRSVPDSTPSFLIVHAARAEQADEENAAKRAESDKGENPVGDGTLESRQSQLPKIGSRAFRLLQARMKDQARVEDRSVDDASYIAEVKARAAEFEDQSQGPEVD